jgi:hypothetical protein
MGSLKKAAGFSVLVALSAVVHCNAPEDSATCEYACDALESCGLLPSPLGIGTSPTSRRENCESRCELSQRENPDTRQVLACYDQAHKKGDDFSWCSLSCQELGSCLGKAFPAQEVTGFGRVAVRVVIRDSENATSGAAGAGGQASVDPIPTAACETTPEPQTTASSCEQAGFSVLRLLPPAGADVDSAVLTQPCVNAVTRGFPVFEMRAGTYRPELKVLGGARPPEASSMDGGVAGAGGESGTPKEGPTEEYCRVVAGGLFHIQAGQTNLVTITVERDVYLEEDLNTCESDCLSGLDSDRDGQRGCEDLVCSARCSQCDFVQDPSGKAIPDCSDPGCLPFCSPVPDPVGSGGANDGSGGADGNKDGSAGSPDGNAGGHGGS